MKNCKISINDIMGLRSVTITNEDENKVIEYVSCVFYSKEKTWNFYVKYTKDEDPKSISFIKINDTEKVNNFFNEIQKNDPIPLEKIIEFSKAVNITLFDVIFTSIQNYVLDKKYEDALQIALKAYEECKDEETLINLANLYQNENIHEEYIKVLQAIPEGHSAFVSSNEELFGYLQSLPIPTNEEPKIKHLEILMKCAINTQKNETAANYFDRLCGGDGFNPCVKSVNGDGNMLIAIAKKMREDKKELESLRKYKIEKEAEADSTHKRKREDEQDANMNSNATSSTSLFVRKT